MPTTQLSDALHAEKYRAPGESFREAMCRVAYALKDSDEHFHKLKDILENQRFLPAGRVQSAMGSPRRITAYNCLSGDTQILTREHGSVAIQDVAGTTVTLLDGNGDWVPSAILCHGVQDTYELDFVGGFGRETIRSTLEHGWVTLSKAHVVKTKALGRNLKKTSVHELRPSKVVKDEVAYRKGVQHGIIYGDGTKTIDGAFQIRVCSHHESITPWFKEFGVTFCPSNNGDPLYRIKIKEAWGELKQLPETDNLDYLLGFIRGWIAADGYVSNQPEATICVGPEEEQWLRKWAPLVGFSFTGSSILPPVTNFGKRNKESRCLRFKKNTIVATDLLVAQHQYRWERRNAKRKQGWRVSGSPRNKRTELVYCPVVPTTHSFALACGVHSANCAVAPTIVDAFTEGENSIMDVARKAAQTMRMGCGYGYDFSTLRPRGAPIKTLGSRSSGPISFMEIFDAVCRATMSAGHRRGAQMGVLRIDHPDIEEFIRAKQNDKRLTGFNVSIAVTDEFMLAVESGNQFELKWGGQSYGKIDARALWEEVMRSTWDWAEPGVLFIDRINEMNNLWYCEKIAATNPCVPGDTQILTSDGYVDIGSVVGKVVHVWNGETFSPVTPFSTGMNELVRVNLSDGTYLDCTPKHEFLIETQGRVEAESLLPGMRLEKIDMPVVKCGVEYPQDAYSQGFYSGGGFANNNKSWIYEPKYFCIPRLKGTIGKEHPIRKFRQWYHGWMLPKNFVPLRGNLDYCLNWLAGLFDSDGTVTRDENGNGIQVASVDKNFLLDVRLMLTRLGVRAKIAPGREAGLYELPDGKGGNRECQCQQVWRLLIGNLDTYNLLKLGLKTERLNLHMNSPQRDARRFVRVVSVEELGYAETFCFTEEKHHRGTFNGIVTGQCSEQPLPPNGTCLLGSFNLVAYVKDKRFDYEQFRADITEVVRAMDNVVDRTIYPLPEQEAEAKAKRRMGLGITGLANALEIMGHSYGSSSFLLTMHQIMEVLRDRCYTESALLAKEKGSFPSFDRELYLNSKFVLTLPLAVRDLITQYGIRNSHLLSIAPTGTISLCADNISAGIEPPFAYEVSRTIKGFDDVHVATIPDYAYSRGVRGKTAMECSINDHLAVLSLAQSMVDSAVSKTININPDTNWEDFERVYTLAWHLGCKGITTYNPAGKRIGVVREVEKPAACYIDPETGAKSCDS